MKIGDSVYTPRFCTVRIKAIFENEVEARAAGFCEPTYYKGDHIILGSPWICTTWSSPLSPKNRERIIAMRVLVVEPECRPEVREIDDSLKAMQEIVGGLIQPIYLKNSVVLVCNDEGKLMDLPANRGLRDKNGQLCDIVCGAFFLCNAPPDSDHFTSLTSEQIKQYRERFYTPEMFWGMDGHIVCLPLEVD